MVAPAGRKAVFLDRDGVLVIPEFRDGRSLLRRAALTSSRFTLEPTTHSDG